jgi:hypothetical protein
MLPFQKRDAVARRKLPSLVFVLATPLLFAMIFVAVSALAVTVFSAELGAAPISRRSDFCLPDTCGVQRDICRASGVCHWSCAWRLVHFSMGGTIDVASHGGGSRNCKRVHSDVSRTQQTSDVGMHATGFRMQSGVLVAELDGSFSDGCSVWVSFAQTDFGVPRERRLGVCDVFSDGSGI